jgi:hypothetical protein
MMDSGRRVRCGTINFRPTSRLSAISCRVGIFDFESHPRLRLQSDYNLLFVSGRAKQTWYHVGKIYLINIEKGEKRAARKSLGMESVKSPPGRRKGE